MITIYKYKAKITNVTQCNNLKKQTFVKRLSSKAVMSETFATKKSFRALVLQ